MELDTIGIDCTVYGNKIRVKNMIAAVEGGVHNGRTLTAADVAAISGCTEEELEKYFHGTSRYLGYSMHDIQGTLLNRLRRIRLPKRVTTLNTLL